jgi:hypothetical protein
MIYRRQRRGSTVPSGFYRFESQDRKSVYGFGDGQFVHLRDDRGNTWCGQAEPQGDHTVRYLFRDSYGNSISGISDHFGILLRDEFGNTWRGYLD